MFLLLPILWRHADNFQPLNQLLHGHDCLAKIQKLILQLDLDKICDVNKKYDDFCLIRLNKTKLFTWLSERLSRVMNAMKSLQNREQLHESNVVNGFSLNIITKPIESCSDNSQINLLKQGLSYVKEHLALEVFLEFFDFLKKQQNLVWHNYINQKEWREFISAPLIKSSETGKFDRPKKARTRTHVGAKKTQLKKRKLNSNSIQNFFKPSNTKKLATK